jgi:hypothetical protein
LAHELRNELVEEFILSPQTCEEDISPLNRIGESLAKLRRDMPIPVQQIAE